MLRPLQDLFNPSDYPDLLVGLGSPDDAAVYRLDAERALVCTTDFFTPIVDDPYDYGAIAGANALSDVYAMGGQPLLALSLVAFPTDLPPNVLGAVMLGLGEKVREAGAVIAGGHSIQDKEPKVGLCVIGMVHPEHVLAKSGARQGDALVLTKPLGSGILATALKQERADPDRVREAVEWMKRLNKIASQVAVAVGVRGGTDITGFGLIGHAWEMAQASGVGLRINLGAVPFLDGAQRYADDGVISGGARSNQGTYRAYVRFPEDVCEGDRLLLFDPQTSGGLLLSIPHAQLAAFEVAMQESGQSYWIIGRVLEGQPEIEVV